ncbi:hypothetical protein C6P43_003959, partial [Kluyveromyces marxianus]
MLAFITESVCFAEDKHRKKSSAMVCISCGQRSSSETNSGRILTMVLISPSMKALERSVARSDTSREAIGSWSDLILDSTRLFNIMPLL